LSTLTVAAGDTAQDPSERKLPGIRYRFKITVEGLMLLIVMILVGFAAWHSGTNLLYLIFAILMAVYLLHGGVLWFNLRKLDVSQVLPETVVVDQPFDINVTVANNKRFGASFAIRVTHRTERKNRTVGSVIFAVIPRKGSVEGYYTTTLHRRGLHELSEVMLATRYPFGFEERSLIKTVHQSVLALPKTYNVSGIGTNISSGFGDQESQVRGAGTDLYGLREYSPGEHSRHIHWRTSARIQKLMISEYSRDERRQVMLFLDNGLSEELQPQAADDFENAITLTASLARHFIHGGFEVGLVTADTDIAYGQGAAQLLVILRHLATLHLTHPHPYAKLPDRMIKIEYHSFDSNASQTRGQTIDSRLWRIPDSSGLDSEMPL